jgi:hypothetical protein
MAPKLDPAVRKAELSIEGLLKLLGGNASQRERFWEIVKGITTPAEYRLANSALKNVASQVDAVKVNLQEVKTAAGEAQR